MKYSLIIDSYHRGCQIHRVQLFLAPIPEGLHQRSAPAPRPHHLWQQLRHPEHSDG